MNIEIQVDSNQLLGQLQALTEDLQIRIRDLVNDTTAKALEVAQETCPRKTGNLMRSIQMEPATLNDVQAHVGTNVDYAVYVHEGARGRTGRPFLQNGMIAGRNFLDANADAYLESATQ